MPSTGDSHQLTQLRKGSIEFCILSILGRGDQYGLQITRELAQADGLVTSEGTVYPILSRLNRDRLVESYLTKSNEGPARRYYRLTRHGFEALTQFSSQWDKFKAAVDQVLGGGGNVE